MDSDILALQLRLQEESFGHDLLKLEGDDLYEYLLMNAYALSDELHEATKEVSWKSWASKKFLNRNKFLGELIDLAHFFNNMWLAVAKLPPTESASLFRAMYADKAHVNALRQEAGYDGVSGKCPHCHRDLAEADTIKLTDVDGEELEACECGFVLLGGRT